MKLHELLDVSLLDRMETEGYVKRASHPRLPLVILNYTAQTQYSREWNDVTMNCRGLIYNSETMDVVTRPFKKFFNLGELQDSDIPRESFEVLPKFDGSLGILYPDPAQVSGYAIATRGSFTSPQALHATALFNERYADFEPHELLSYMFEIIYPNNRIVVDYHGMDDLVLLDVLWLGSGGSFGGDGVDERWPGPRVEPIGDINSLKQLLELPQPDNFEGYVVRFNSGLRVKIKTDEYTRLHRIVTGVSTKTIWQYLSDGRDLNELVDRVPDEFHDFVRATTNDLYTKYSEIRHEAFKAFHAAYWTAITVRLEPFSTEHRKVFALGLSGPYRSLGFLYYDISHQSHVNNDITPIETRLESAIWKLIQPEYAKPFSNQTEDVA